MFSFCDAEAQGFLWQIPSTKNDKLKRFVWPFLFTLHIAISGKPTLKAFQGWFDLQIHRQGELAKGETCPNPFHIYFLGNSLLLEGFVESLIATIGGCQIYNFSRIAIKLGSYGGLVRPPMFGGPGLIYSNPIHLLLLAFIHLLISEDFQFKRGPSGSLVSEHADNISDISWNNCASLCKFNPFGLSETIRTKNTGHRKLWISKHLLKTLFVCTYVCFLGYMFHPIEFYLRYLKSTSWNQRNCSK